MLPRLNCATMWDGLSQLEGTFLWISILHDSEAELGIQKKFEQSPVGPWKVGNEGKPGLWTLRQENGGSRIMRNGLMCFDGRVRKIESRQLQGYHWSSSNKPLNICFLQIPYCLQAFQDESWESTTEYLGSQGQGEGMRAVKKGKGEWLQGRSSEGKLT